MDKELEVFILEPTKEFHVRELAKLLKKSPTTISKKLQKLNKEGLLSSRRKFNHLLFKANNENFLFKNLKLSYNLKKLFESGLVDYLIDEFNHPEAIILFGSFAKAENIPGSDIDLFILTPVKKELHLKKFEMKLKTPIQIFTSSKKEVEKMKIKNKELLNNLINGQVLEGHWEVFR